MELGALLALAALVAAASLLVVYLRAVERTPDAVTGLWRFGEWQWPHGVQEDDDLHWSWTPAGPAAEDDTVVQTPALDVQLTPLRYRVHPGDRARS